MKIKRFYRILTVALALVLVIGIFGACDNGNNIGGGGGNGGNQYLHITDGDDTNVQSGINYAMPNKMTFTSPTSLSQTASAGITITANIEPSYATNKEVDWFVSFVDPEHTWAVGKTASDFVSVEPTSAGSVTAVVECLEAFGAEIQITVTSQINPLATASCKVNYVQRFNGVNKFYFESATETYADGTKVPDIVFDQTNVTMDWIDLTNLTWKNSAGEVKLGSAYDKTFPASNSGFGIPGKAVLDLSQSNTYTIENTLTTKIKVWTSNGFADGFAPGLGMVLAQKKEIDLSLTNDYLGFMTLFTTTSIGSLYCFSNKFTSLHHFGDGGGLGSGVVGTLSSTSGPDFYMSITVTPEYGEPVVTEYNITINRASLTIAPQSITLDGDIIF